MVVSELLIGQVCEETLWLVTGHLKELLGIVWYKETREALVIWFNMQACLLKKLFFLSSDLCFLKRVVLLYDVLMAQKTYCILATVGRFTNKPGNHLSNICFREMEKERNYPFFGLHTVLTAVKMKEILKDIFMLHIIIKMSLFCLAVKPTVYRWSAFQNIHFEGNVSLLFFLSVK